MGRSNLSNAVLKIRRSNDVRARHCSLNRVVPLAVKVVTGKIVDPLLFLPAHEILFNGILSRAKPSVCCVRCRPKTTYAYMDVKYRMKRKHIRLSQSIECRASSAALNAVRTTRSRLSSL